MSIPKFSPSSLLLAATALLAAASFWSSGCQLLKPVNPAVVNALQVEDLEGSLKISWDNPVEFHNLEVEVTHPGGKVEVIRVEKHPFTSPYPLDPGKQGILLPNVPPGPYKVRVSSYVGEDLSTRRSTEAVERKVAKPVAGHIDWKSLNRPAPEDLQVLYLVHPETRALSRNASSARNAAFERRIFGQVAANVLSEVFEQAIPIRHEADLKKIEEDRIVILERHGSESAFLDPDALAIVDLREPSDPSTPPQLYLRILDLKLVKNARRGSAINPQKGILVAEGFAEVEPFQQSKEIAYVLEEAWKSLLREVLEHPRYLAYKNFLAAVKKKEPLADEAKLEIEALFYGEIPEALQPLEEGGKGYSQEKLKRLEKLILFGPEATPDKTGEK
ncbi:MAG: hypothetical protein HY717_01515 [Planctomycetes bacterium]|nr:hypothetical protein [Planctomycetota bacterium]